MPAADVGRNLISRYEQQLIGEKLLRVTGVSHNPGDERSDNVVARLHV